MFLHSIKTDCMICDFQLIYESDGRLMLDLYAYGQVKEPVLLGSEAAVNCIDCGLISVSCNDFKKLELKLDTICHDKTLIKKYTEQMHFKMMNLIEKCTEMEKNIKQIMKSVEIKERIIPEKKDIRVMYEGFNTVTDVIAYRRLADKAGDYLAAKIGIDKTAAIKVPSYLVLFEEEKNKLGSHLTEEELERFCWEYGYLEGFSIQENKWEDIDYVKKYSAGKKGQPGCIKPLVAEFCPPTGCTPEEYILYELSWYSECKHIYQLRVLRNLRKYMQLLNLDIIKTDAKGLFKDVSTFK